MSSASRPFLEARDFLLANRTDSDAARRGFRWPRLERFNWALDHFDELAKGNEPTAPWVVDEGGGETKQKREAGAVRGEREFLEEDFPELKAENEGSARVAS